MLNYSAKDIYQYFNKYNNSISSLPEQNQNFKNLQIWYVS